MEKKFQIQSKEEGERLDKVLCFKLPKYSRKQIKNLLDGGKVLVNNRRVVIAGWHLESGDEVTVKVDEKPRFEARTRSPKARSRRALQGINLRKISRSSSIDSGEWLGIEVFG